MASNVAVESLLKERQKLVDERNKLIEKFNEDISELETAIERLSGKKVWETAKDYVYDDENPDYIKGSLEEI